MFGYIIAGVMGLLLLAVIFVAMSQGKTGPGNRGRRSGPGPVQTENPSADAPNPDRSATADRDEVRNARQHTPPA